MTALDALARDGRVVDAGLAPETRAALRGREARRLQLVAAGESAWRRPDPDAAAFDEVTT